MADGTLLRDFAQTLAAKVVLAKADHAAPEDALFAIGEIVHAAKRDPHAWLERDRWRPPGGQAASPASLAAAVYAARAARVAGKG
jgi:hypothetical protein